MPWFLRRVLRYSSACERPFRWESTSLKPQRTIGTSPVCQKSVLVLIRMFLNATVLSTIRRTAIDYRNLVTQQDTERTVFSADGKWTASRWISSRYPRQPCR